MSTVAELSRPQMLDVGREIMKRLKERKKQGPKEDALDAYIPELDAVVKSLETHVDGKVLADAARTAMLARSEAADIDVDTWLRHHESFVFIEANRRDGPNVAAVKALYATAFPDGLGHIDDYIPDENRLCRDAVTVLESPEHAATVKAIELPAAWLPKWKAALDESDQAFDAVQKARTNKKTHVGAGQDAETDFIDGMVRLRRYIGSRAARSDTAKIAEGRTLLDPLLVMLDKSKAEKGARATRKANAKPGPVTPPESPPG
jgi:hypothetical protein